MGDRVAKDALFDGFADIAKALANGRRAELIDVLAQGERHVEELADEIGQSLANTSLSSCGAHCATSLPHITLSSTSSLPPTSGTATSSTS